MNYYEDPYLMHYGVLGMKWGVRKQERTAKKDAKEYARAKMYYGQGAGNRRKLINATVNERSKDENYKKAFEKHLANQNMADHAKKAKSERKRTDVKNTTKKTARGLINASVGNLARASAAAIALYGIAKVTGADQVIAKYAKQGFNIAKENVKVAYNIGKSWFNTARNKKSYTFSKEQLRSMGIDVFDPEMTEIYRTAISQIVPQVTQINTTKIPGIRI